MLSSPSALSWNLLFYTFCCPFLPGLPVTRWNCISVIKLKLINNNVPSLQTGSSWKAWWRRSSGNPGRPCEYLSLNHIFYLPYCYLDKILIWWLFLGRSRSERSHRWGRASGSAGKNNNTSTLISVCCFSCLHFITLCFESSSSRYRGNEVQLESEECQDPKESLWAPRHLIYQ